MTDDPRRPGASRRRRTITLVLGGSVLAAVIGGVVGGLIVRATWGSGNASSSGDTTGACPATSVSDKALPSVVTVRAGASSGSGVVIRTGGYILTNNHVISAVANGGPLSIQRSDGETTDATLVGRDTLTDLAVIKATDSSELPTIVLGKSESLAVGEPVVALGSPLGLTSTVTGGIVSALDRYVRVPGGDGQAAHLVGAIQTDASINPGNSGGALVDCAAQLVGINTAGATVATSGGGSIGLGFAIPIDLADEIASELIDTGKVTRPSFGMQVYAVPAGLFVTAVASGGPADAAGLRPGDVIVEIDGEQAHGVDALVVRTLKMSAGDTVQLTYMRQGARHSTTLTLASG
ncbi:MAG TPA: trypsin-like peptidase domain-containing protein [Gaiellaceae bacterium]|nr:trypsin-like peptidase domain-containing protein [Gaiellaceae bacterium]